MADGYYCQIRVKGQLSEPWSDWFGGLDIRVQPGGETLLCGHLRDQSALHGVMERIRDAGVELVAIRCESERLVGRGWEDAAEKEPGHSQTIQAKQ